MPEVDEVANIEEVFERARRVADGETEQPPGNPPGRQVVVVTPGRMLMLQACPPPGSMPRDQVAAMEQLISPTVRRKVAAIAYTEVGALTSDISSAIPFLGMLLGLAYIGHLVWVFEGHPSALAAGCRDADLVIVDGGMVPYLQDGWEGVASSGMKNREIYVHDRSTFSLRKAPQY